MNKEKVNIVYEVWFLVVLCVAVVLGLLIFYFGLPRLINSSEVSNGKQSSQMEII